MKHGKKPTREQRKLIEANSYYPEDWLVVKDTPMTMVIVNRHTGAQKVINKVES